MAQEELCHNITMEPIRYNQVTWYSKLLALVLFLTLPAFAYRLGSEYGKATSEVDCLDSRQKPVVLHVSDVNKNPATTTPDTVVSAVPVCSGRCPVFAPPAPNWCLSPKIKVLSRKDSCGCIAAPVCESPAGFVEE